MRKKEPEFLLINVYFSICFIKKIKMNLYPTFNNSTSKIKSACGGIDLPEPRAP
jgi:hypothetical protein